MKSESRPSLLAKQGRLNRFAMPLLWSGGILVCAAMAALLSAGPARVLVFQSAGIALLPALVMMALAKVLKEDWAQALVVLSWTMLAGLACASTGGVATPFVLFFILPVIAAQALGGIRLTMEAAALSMFALVLVVALGSGGLLPVGLGQPVAMLAPASAILVLIVSASTAAIRMQGGWDERTAGLHVLRYMPGPVLCLDGAGRILAASPLAAQMVGRERTLDQHMPATARTRLVAAIERVLRGTKSEKIDVDFTDAQNTPLQIEMTLTRRGTRTVLAGLHDVTARVARASALAAQRDAALNAAHEKAQFLAGISHELRTPLNAIIGFSDMMKARLFGPMPAKYAEYADLIYDSGRHLVDLVGDVLDISKIEADRYELSLSAFDSRDVITSSTKLMQLTAEEAGVTLRAEVPAKAVPTLADRKALRQIMFNLLSNAIKFTPAGGRVNVFLRHQGKDVVIIVADDGVGMSQDDLERVGKPYQQASSAQVSEARGTGLGMALVKAMTKMHGGTMRMESELGKGTRVCLRLPIVDTKTKGEVTQLDVRDHIRRAQEASEKIAQAARKVAG